MLLLFLSRSCGLLREACWPKVWCLHHVCPLYKRDSAFAAGNYRGIHLTSILSKLADRPEFDFSFALWQIRATPMGFHPRLECSRSCDVVDNGLDTFSLGRCKQNKQTRHKHNKQNKQDKQDRQTNRTRRGDTGRPWASRPPAQPG